MGLRCLLGHDFGEPEVEREREEEGNEMVATIREVKTCRRCGERQIVSENKEVTAIRSAEEVGLDDEESEPTHPAVDEGDAADGEFDPPADADADDGVILDEEPPERDLGEWPDHDGEATPTADAADAADAAEGLGADEMATEDEISRAGERPAADDAVEDDAEFIDADGEAADDEGGVAWPEHEDPNGAAADDADADGPTPWPEHEGEDEDEGYKAGPASGAGDDDHGVTFGSGFTPETTNGGADAGEATHDAGGGSTGVAAEAENGARGEGFDAEFVGGPDTSTDAGEEFARVESESVELEAEMEGVPTEYFCPNCGYTREGTGSSMRAGDICPECRKGYMAEREA